MLANTHWIPMYKKTKKEGESFDDWYERFMFGLPKQNKAI